MNKYASQFIFILVEPEIPENIGASARAIKNMGFRELRLVNPVQDWYERGKKMAPHAEDVLKGAKVYKSVPEAISDIQWTFGSTRRVGPKRGTYFPFPRAACEVRNLIKKHKVAMLFGKESKGLDNESLSLCDCVTSIPTDEDCPSINLAQAVMVVAFALTQLEDALPTYMHRGKLKMRKVRELEFIPKEEVLDVLSRVRSSMIHLGYKQQEGQRTADRITNTWQRLFKRSGLLYSEAQMLRGLTRRIQDRVVLQGSIKDQDKKLIKK